MATLLPFNVKVYERPEIPPVGASLTRNQIHELAKLEDVGMVFFDDREMVLTAGLIDTIKTSRADRAHELGFRGSGVRVGVWEDGPKNLTDLVFEGRYIDNPFMDVIEDEHARVTSGIIKNTEAGKSHGFAPDCLLYSANATQ